MKDREWPRARRWASRASAAGRLGAALVFAFAAAIGGVDASEQATVRPTPVHAECVLEIGSATGVQLDVWIDGKPAGKTPLRATLGPGNHVATAFAMDTMPIVRTIAVRDQPRQAILLVDRPFYATEYEKAFVDLVNARRAHPSNAHIPLMCAMLARERTDFDNLVALVPKEHREDAMLQVARARWTSLEGDLAGALEEVDAATERDPTAAACWRAKAELLTAMGRYDEALDAAQRAVLLDSRHPKSFFVRAKVEEALGDERAAELDREHFAELSRRRDEQAERISDAAAKKEENP